ncbi:MAG TPA: peptidylprolyl isomerase [Opitutaceae bacterium]|nr:peptidylprolyl isomerase [Opitutaceae bacterium]
MPKSVVSFHYTLRNKDGQLLDSSTGGEPIAFLEGSGQIIDGLESALLGVAAGAKLKVEVAAARAYGERDATLVRKVKRGMLPVDEITLGDMFQTGQDRHAPVVTVTAIDGDDVTLDANHPLAGVDLVFDTEIVGVREATADEVAHGHAHGPGGHHHH